MAHEVDDLGDLGVPEKRIEDLRVEDRKMQATFKGRMEAGTGLRNHNRGLRNRAVKGLALQPLTGKSTKEIMIEAGYSSKQTNNSFLVKSITNSKHFTAALARYGIGPNAVANAVADGIMAEVPMTTRKGVVVTLEDGSPVMVPDHGVRRGYIDMAIKVAGGYHESEKKGIEINAETLAIVTRIEEMPLEDAKLVAEGNMEPLQEEGE